MILSSESPDTEDLEDQGYVSHGFTNSLRYLEIYQSAMDLYGLIHARFILSPRGLALMREKYMLGTFGTCQRVLCERQFVLPIGLSEELSTSRVKVSVIYLPPYLIDLLARECRPTARAVKKSMYLNRSTWTSTEPISGRAFPTST